MKTLSKIFAAPLLGLAALAAMPVISTSGIAYADNGVVLIPGEATGSSGANGDTGAPSSNPDGGTSNSGAETGTGNANGDTGTPSSNPDTGAASAEGSTP